MREWKIRGNGSFILTLSYIVKSLSLQILKLKVIPTVLLDGPLNEDRLMEPKTFLSSARHSNTTLEDLREIWNISIEQAKMTLESTTQHHARSEIMPLSRRYRLDRMYEPKRI